MLTSTEQVNEQSIGNGRKGAGHSYSGQEDVFDLFRKKDPYWYAQATQEKGSPVYGQEQTSAEVPEGPAIDANSPWDRECISLSDSSFEVAQLEPNCSLSIHRAPLHVWLVEDTCRPMCPNCGYEFYIGDATVFLRHPYGG